MSFSQLIVAYLMRFMRLNKTHNFSGMWIPMMTWISIFVNQFLWLMKSRYSMGPARVDRGPAIFFFEADHMPAPTFEKKSLGLILFRFMYEPFTSKIHDTRGTV